MAYLSRRAFVFYPKIEVLKTTETVKLNKDTGKCDHATVFDILTVSDTSKPANVCSMRPPG